MNEIIQIIGIGWFAVALFMTILWYIGKKIQNYAIVDVGWTIALVILSSIYSILGDGWLPRRILIGGMVGFWGLRLGGYLLFTRILGGHGEDQRYVAFRKDYGDKVDQKFFTNIFQFQGLLDLVLAIPFLLIAMNPIPEFTYYDFIGLGIFLIAIIGEGIADNQLHTFKKKPENKGKNCEVGLWYYSRHPNYFFEWLTWISYGVISLGSEYGYLGFLSAILMYIFLTKFTGVPMTEKYALEKRGDVYREYQKSTSPFIPWFKKKP
ncbi:MAG: DUF1295 domain-containing protein [Leptospiraceae bacterium]|nr:DUF1295 domain-containing protein [Leptospiraceae bacterium]MCP5510948.1 DUF1295 domain-containing protein [Leptospiraceae bacterium]